MTETQFAATLIAWGFSVALVFLAAFVWLGLDAQSRGESAPLWMLLLCLLGPLALLVWVCVRPRRSPGQRAPGLAAAALAFALLACAGLTAALAVAYLDAEQQEQLR